MAVAKMNMNTTFLLLSSSTFLRKWTRNLTSTLDSLVSSYLNKFFKTETSCGKFGISETSHGKQKKLKQMIDLLEFVGTLLNKNKGFKTGYAKFEYQKKFCVDKLRNRRPDYGCDPCITFTCVKINDPKLHVAVKEASYKDPYENHYLDACSICRKSLHNRDIFMYRGNIPFCSTECRQEQFEMDEVMENKMRFDRSLRKSDYKNSTPNKIVPMRIVTVS